MSKTGDSLTSEAIERALEYLVENATGAAQARANRVYMEEYRKVLKSQIMQEHAFSPLGSQERDAYADSRYVDHIKALKEAVFEDEKHRFLLEAAKARIDAWRTMQANERATHKVI